MRTSILKTGLLAPLLLPLLLAAAGSAVAQIDPAAFYQIVAKHSGKCLDVAGGPDAVGNGVRVIQFECNGAANQQWKLVPVGDGYYKVLAKHSGKSLDVFGGNIATGNGVIVEQWDYHDGDNQLWRFDPVEEGYYRIVAKHSGKSLDINGGPDATGNEVQAQQWDDVGGSNQRWRLTPTAATGVAGVDNVTGTFTYSDTEAESAGAASFPRPIAGALVQVWRAGALAVSVDTDNAGAFNVNVPHLPDGTDTTVLIYATNAAAQVLAGFGPYYVSSSQRANAGAPLDFSTNFDGTQQVRSFNAAHDIRLAYDYARARRAPEESEVIPKVDVSFNDLGGLMTHYNAPGSGLVIGTEHNRRDLVILHEYAHFLEDKIGSFLLLPSYHDTCFTTQRCQVADKCAPLPEAPLTQLVNTPENAWMEGFANYFAMAVKRANPTERLNLTSGGTLSEGELDHPSACAAVGLAAFDGHMINGEMIERYVAGALWSASRSGDPAASETAVFQIFDHELDGSANGLLPNIKQFHDAWVGRALDHPELDRILGDNIPTVAAHNP